MIALLESARAGLFTRKHLVNNLIAGLVVGIVALPLAMAFAIASGVKPEQGIYTAIIAGFLASTFGGSRVQITGPTGAFIVILSGITALHGVEGLQIATLMAGVILLALGFARLGTLIKFIPSPVIVGFTSGIGVIIFVGQWKDFFGLSVAPAQHFHEKLALLFLELPYFHPATALLAVFSLALVILTPRVTRHVPGPLVAMVAATALQAMFKFPGVATIGQAFGGIPQVLPAFHLPDLSIAKMITLAGPALAIAMLGAIESLLSAVVADGMAGTKHDSNQELIGQGIANIAAPLFGGFAATGAIARTATNIRSGGTSPLAGIAHAGVLLLIILFLAPLASDIPLCALSAILFMVAWNMSEAHRFIWIAQRAPKNDVAILLMTFFLTVFVDLVVAVNTGVILAALMFMQKMAGAVTIAKEEPHSADTDTLTYTVNGPLFFGDVAAFEHALAATHTDPKAVVICLSHVPFIDMTGIEALEGAISAFKKRGVAVTLAGANERVRKKLEKAGIVVQAVI